MFNPSRLIGTLGTALAVALTLAAAGATPASAQYSAGTGQTGTGTQGTVTGQQVLPGRIGGGRTDTAAQERQQRRARPAAAPTPEQNKAAAVAIAAVAAPTCQVGEATLLGQNAEKQAIYEATCATGPGYILIATTPPQAVDCVILAGQADISRSRDPAADVGLQCKLPANTDILKVVTAYATEAGVTCTPDKGASIGKSSEGFIIYEVGCAGTDGAWIEQKTSGWAKTPCMLVVTQNGTCKFTTPEEQAATLKGWLASSAASGCDVSQARYMGANANGVFYEAKCASGDGYVTRFNTEMAVQQVYPCADAIRIGGGCKIGVAAAPAEAAPAPTPAPAAAVAPSVKPAT